MTEQTIDSVQHPHLRTVLSSLAEVCETCERLGRELSPEALGWSPGDGQWSILQVIAHLRVTGELYNPRLADTVARTRERGLESTAPYRPTLIGGWFAKLVTPEPRRRFKAPGKFLPAGDSSTPEEIARFLAHQEEFSAIVRSADGLDLNRLRFGSPITALLRFSIGDGIQLMANHQVRHMGQIQRIAGASGFPG